MQRGSVSSWGRRSAGAALLGLALGVATQAGAQQAPKRITFDDAVQIALTQSTAVLQAKNATALDAASVQQQKLAFLPDLRVSTSTAGNLGRNFSEGEGRIVDQTTQSVSAGLSSTVTLFDGFKNVSALRQAQSSEEASNKDLERARQTAVFTVASNFVALVAGQEQLRVQQENLAAQQVLEQQIAQFVKAGTRPISDQYQQQATVASASASVVEAQRTLELAKVDLIQTLQLDPSGTYDFVPPTVSDAAAIQRDFNLDSLMTKAFAHRVDLDAQAARVEAASQGVKAADAGRWPTVSLSAGYNTTYNSATDLGFTDQLDQRRGGSLSIGLSIPLFDRGNASIAAERAQLQKSNAELALQTTRQDVALQVRRAYLDFRAAQERLKAAEAQQQAAALAVQTSQERYRVGASTLVEVTQARASETQAQSALVNARYNLVFQKAVMTYYTGELDPASVSLS